MQLTRFTDLGLRVLMYLTYKERTEPVTIPEIADIFQVSRNHLVKVVHFMAQQKWLITTRGKGGGMALAHPPEHYRIGDIVRTLEDNPRLIDCDKPPCVLKRSCQLSGALQRALNLFFEDLNRYTLADVASKQTQTSIIELHRLGGHA